MLLSVNAAWNVVNFRAGLIRALIEAGHEVLVATPADEHEADITALGARFIPVEMTAIGMSPVQDLALYRRYRAMMRRECPDIYLGYTIKPNVYGSLAAHSLGIATINNVSGLGTGFLSGRLLRIFIQLLYRRAFRRSHRVFFQNPDDRDLFFARGLVRREQADLLPGSGIDLVRFKVSPPSPRDGRPMRFLMIGRLLRQKGVIEYVAAARMALAAGLPAEFHFLGFLDAANVSAIGRAELDGWIDAGIIHFHPATRDVRPHIAEADVVVLPSYREGLPRTLLEGAAMSRPLIATDVPGCRHIAFPGTKRNFGAGWRRNRAVWCIRDDARTAARRFRWHGR